jgi:hypothetical protein
MQSQILRFTFLVSDRSIEHRPASRHFIRVCLAVSISALLPNHPQNGLFNIGGPSYQQLPLSVFGIHWTVPRATTSALHNFAHSSKCRRNIFHSIQTDPGLHNVHYIDDCSVFRNQNGIRIQCLGQRRAESSQAAEGNVKADAGNEFGEPGSAIGG